MIPASLGGSAEARAAIVCTLADVDAKQCQQVNQQEVQPRVLPFIALAKCTQPAKGEGVEQSWSNVQRRPTDGVEQIQPDVPRRPADKAEQSRTNLLKGPVDGYYNVLVLPCNDVAVGSLMESSRLEGHS